MKKLPRIAHYLMFALLYFIWYNVVGFEWTVVTALAFAAGDTAYNNYQNSNQ